MRPERIFDMGAQPENEASLLTAGKDRPTTEMLQHFRFEQRRAGGLCGEEQYRNFLDK